MTVVFNDEFTISTRDTKIFVNITSGENYVWIPTNIQLNSITGTDNIFTIGSGEIILELDFTKSINPPVGTTRSPYLESVAELVQRGLDLEVNGNNINLIRVADAYNRSDIFGENTAVNCIERILAPGMPLSSGVNITFPLTSITLSIASTNVNDTSTGTGARTIQVFGLDSDFNQISEIFTLDGQTPVNSTKTFFRVQEAIVLTTGTTVAGTNLGFILISDSSDTFVLGVPQTRCYDSMEPGTSFSKTLIFTVPKDRILLAQSLTISTNATGNNRLIAKLRIENDVDIEGTSINNTIYIDTTTSLNLINSRRRLPGIDVYLTVKATNQPVSVHAKFSTIIAEQIAGDPNIF